MTPIRATLAMWTMGDPLQSAMTLTVNGIGTAFKPSGCGLLWIQGGAICDNLPPRA
jgi:hypothetical protein